MKKLLITIVFLLSSSIFMAQTEVKVYQSLLKNYISSNGKIDYKGLKKNETILDIYLDYLDKKIPLKKWSSDKAKAYWLNVYNAYTLKLVLDNYPINSLKDIKKENRDAWGISFVKAGGSTYTLDYIEHKILRRWHDDPRIHVGINSASMSGPRFPNFVFTEENTENKLNYLIKVFLNDRSKNKLSPKSPKISKIFQWYKEDFTIKGSLISFINKYAITKINQDASIQYLEYDWGLNEFTKK